jgi:AraC-like DNA-binding protein
VLALEFASFHDPRVTSITRTPRVALRPFVQTVWAFDACAEPAAVHRGMERVLPTGGMHVVIRLSPAPLTLFDDATGANPRVIGHSLVGGARSAFYVRSVAEPSHSIGAQLQPGAAFALFGVSAAELAERHTPLEDLWGREAERVREQLATAGSLEVELELFEAILTARLTNAPALHPATADALARLAAGACVADVVRHSGCCHRAFIATFRAAVGLTPKTFCRVRRFQQAIERLGRERTSLADLAGSAGYADQAHLTREFAAFSGVSPAAYRRLSPAASNHVPIRT